MPAVVRLPRTVAARRALLVTLFLGGLLGLAFLFGGSAQAAESSGLTAGTSEARSAGTLLDSSATDEVGERTEQGVAEGTERIRKSAPRPEGLEVEKVGEVVEGAVEPVAERTEHLTRPVGEVVEDSTDGAIRLPVGDSGGTDNGADRPGNGQDRPAHQGRDTSGSAQSSAGQAQDTVQRNASDREQPRGDSAAERTAGQSPAGTQHRDRLPGQLPQAPHGLNSQNTADGSGPRGGDTHAALAANDTRFGLVAGAVREANGSPTRERSTEILEFPG